MSTLREYAHPRIGEIVSTLHAQVYWLTRCKQQYLDGGQPGTSEDFAYAEAVARIAVKELDALDQELNQHNSETPSLLGV